MSTPNLSRRNGNSLIGTRIQLLTSKKAQNSKNNSPILNDLKRAGQVKNLLEFYEKKTCEWNGKSDANCWTPRTSSPKHKFKFTPDADKFSPQIFTFSPPVALQIAPKSVPKLDDAAMMQLLRQLEREHIVELEKTIKDCEKIVHEGVGFVAMKMRENSFCLSGDLREIYRLHTIVIFPQLSKSIMCNHFVTILMKLLDDGQFYCYIRHKMLEKSMLKRLFAYILVPRGCPNLSQTFNILEVYLDWIGRIFKELMKHPTENADDIAVFMDAEVKLMSLMDEIADAENVARIMQVADIPIEIEFKVFDIIKKRHRHKMITEPMLILIPKKSSRFSFRLPLDVMQMGNFKKSFNFMMSSQEYCCKNEARFFVFERCVIYSIVVAESYNFENHFWVKDITFNVATQQFNNKMYAELTNCNHTVQVDHPGMLKLLMDLKLKHHSDEITAEIDMSDRELIKIVESCEDVMKWRRHSLVASEES